jgi:hypothetical protein
MAIRRLPGRKVPGVDSPLLQSGREDAQVNEPQSVSSTHLIGMIACWVCAGALVDFFVPLFMSSGPEEAAGFLAGVAGGQLGVLTVWAVFGPERLLLRWATALLAAALLFGAILVGLVISVPAVGTEPFAALLMLPAVFLAAQAPLWIVRMITGWEIVPRGVREVPSAASRQFGLQHLLGATTAVAATLALAKIGFLAMRARGSSGTAEEWLGLAIACLVAGLWNGLLTIPCLYATMVVKERRRGCFVVAGYLVVLSIVVPIVMFAILGPAPLAPKAFMVFLSFNGAVALVVAGGLHLLGQSGYVLRRPRAGWTSEPADVAASPTAHAAPGSQRPD